MTETRRLQRIAIQVSEAEKTEIQDFAAADHTEVSPWCRQQIQRAIDEIKYQAEARQARLEMIRRGKP